MEFVHRADGSIGNPSADAVPVLLASLQPGAGLDSLIVAIQNGWIATTNDLSKRVRKELRGIDSLSLRDQASYEGSAGQHALDGLRNFYPVDMKRVAPNNATVLTGLPW